jgi:putative membrane protein
MKLNLILVTVVACFGLGLNAQSTDPVKQANQSNENKSGKWNIDQEVADFLVKSADARMMDKMEGAMAAKKGTTVAVRQYGMLMVKDQAILLNKLKALAAAKNISLPNGISNKKESGRADLSEKTGKDFDDKFIKMMRIDHERDVKMFSKAASSDDKDIRSFASKYLPMIQLHLDKINALEKMVNK